MRKLCPQRLHKDYEAIYHFGIYFLTDSVEFKIFRKLCLNYLYLPRQFSDITKEISPTTL